MNYATMVLGYKATSSTESLYSYNITFKYKNKLVCF